MLVFNGGLRLRVSKLWTADYKEDLHLKSYLIGVFSTNNNAVFRFSQPRVSNQKLVTFFI